MSVKQSSATALVRFTGLGIVCLNKDKQRGEIAAIRDGKHTLTISIEKPVYQDRADGDIIIYQPIASYENLPQDDVQIEIKAEGKPAIEGFEIYQSGDFDRLESADVNDFRWIVNMSALHGEAALTSSSKEKHPLSRIHISNGLFYSHKLDTNIFFEKVQKDDSGKVTQREAFGNVAETVGVKLEGDEVSFTIRIAGREETHSLKRVEGLPFRVVIKNMDYSANAVYSDMPDYYRYLSSPSGQQFDLTPVIEDEDGKSGGAFNQREFCHPILVDDPPGIDGLGG